MKKIVVLVVLIVTSMLLFRQDPDKARNYFENEKYELAAKEFESCLPELRSYYGKNDTTNYSWGIFYTAKSYFLDQQYDKAEKYFIQGKEIYDRINGQNNPYYLYFLIGLIDNYSQIGENDKAILMLQDALQKFENIHGKDFPNYAWLLIALGDIYFDLVEYEKTLPSYTEALEIREKVLGKEHPDYEISLNNLATLYFVMGQYENALPLYLEDLEISEKILGKEHPDYVVSLNNLAGLYNKMGQSQKALPLFLEALKIIEKAFGKEHHDYVTYLNSIAYLHYDLGQYEKALPLYIESIEIREKVLGKEHPDYVVSLNNLAFLYDKMVQYEKALPLYLEALEIIEKSLGKKHPDYATSLNNLAHLYDKMDQYEKALPFYLEALEIEEKVSGKDHPNYASLLNNLAQLYSVMGQYEKSLPLYIEAHEIIEKILGKEHPDYANSLNNLARLYYKMGQYEKALPLYLEALKIIEKAMGKEHPNYAFLLDNLALLYSHMGQYEKALSFSLEALEIIDKVLGKEHPDYAITLNNYAASYYVMGQYEKALPLYFESLEIEEKVLGKEHPGYAYSLDNLAILYSDMGQYEKALPFYLEALEIEEKILGKEHPDYATSLNNYACLYSKMGKYEKALPLFLEAEEISKKILGKEHPLYATSLINLSFLYSNIGQYEKALPICLEAVDIRKNVFGIEHPDNSTFLNKLAVLYSDMGHNEKAMPIFQQAIENSLFNISKNFAFLSENEKNQFLTNFRYSLYINQSFFKTYTSQNPSVAADAYNLELATKSMILQSGIQMRQAILNSDDEKALKKYDEWMVIRASLAKQYSLPLAQRSEDLKDMEFQAEKFESELNRLSNTFKQAQSIGSIKWQDVQQQLGENEVAIEFSSFPYYHGEQWTDSVIYTANVLRPGDEHPHLVYLCEQRQLDSLLYRPGNTEPAFIAGLYRGVVIEASIPSYGRRLYELIWKPIAHLLPEGRTVFFAPSGSLHQIAHAAIPVDENTLLSDKYKLVQLSTTAALLQDDDRNETVAGEIALFGSIEYNIEADELIALSEQNQEIGYQHAQRFIPAGLERTTEAWSYLLGTLTEVVAIGTLAVKQGIIVNSFTGKEALEERFKALSGNNSPAILHIATHAFFFPDPEKELKSENFMLMGEQQQVFRASDNPLNRAGLLFAGANHTWQGDTVPEGVDDGILTAWEATNLTLTNTRLVTLSACETGLGEVRGSEGVFGLQRAFKAAGAGYLLMSLWKVPDTETAEFMAFFYDRLFEGTAITDAFHATQHYMKTLYPTEPYKWAAFILLR